MNHWGLREAEIKLRTHTHTKVRQWDQFILLCWRRPLRHIILKIHKSFLMLYLSLIKEVWPSVKTSKHSARLSGRTQHTPRYYVCAVKSPLACCLALNIIKLPKSKANNRPVFIYDLYILCLIYFHSEVKALWQIERKLWSFTGFKE